MIRQKLSHHLLFSLSLILTWATVTAAPVEHWTPTEILKAKGVQDVQVSPLGDWAIFTVTEAKMTGEESTYVSHLHLASTDNTRTPFQFTQGKDSCFHPRWSPDGKRIAFLSKRTGKVNIHLIYPDGGEAAPLTDVPTGVQTFIWSPDSTRIAFVMADPETDEEKQAKEEKDDAYVVEKEFKRNRLWMVNVANRIQEPTDLTGEKFHVRGKADFGAVFEDLDWSSNGRYIAFTHSPDSRFDTLYREASLGIVNLITNEVRTLPNLAPHESNPRFDPTSQWIAYLKSDPEATFTLTRHIAIRSVTTNKDTDLAGTEEEGAFLVGSSLLGWDKAGKNVLFVEPSRTSFQLLRVPSDGSEPREIAKDLTPNRRINLNSMRTHLGFVTIGPTTPPEAWVAQVDAFTPRQITHINDEMLHKPFPHTELVRWTSPDETEVEGLLTYPINYQTGKSYPLVLMIHGGPMSFFPNDFVGKMYPYSVAALAEMGVATLRPNPRGSCGYGKQFRAANQRDWGGGDFQDLMAGVDYVINRGIADPKKLGVAGWSFGGYMTAWTVTQTNRFKAASMGAGMSNLISKVGTCDICHLYADYFQGFFWDDPTLYVQRSPLFHVKNVSTPLLIQHGDGDQRVPTSQSFEFYRALKLLDKPVELVIYPRTGHHPAEPKLQRDEMERNLNWFALHLLEEPNPV